MKTSDYFYELPDELIAQSPVEPRDASRLLVIDRAAGALTHSSFRELPAFLNAGDLLILNDSKVFPARLLPEKPEGSEILLLEQKSADIWECIGKKLKAGRELYFGDDLSAEVIKALDNGNRLVKFTFSSDFFAILDKIGHTPLPHYITQELGDASRYKNRYNTIYANEAGSAAAPTAGAAFH
jgi:S-adenosylmethionine:tRNA ribosyltransferase-isomerase